MEASRGIRAILVQRRLLREKSYLYELRELARVAGYIPIFEVEQVRPPDSAYQIGSGKAKELAELVRKVGAERVIFFNELKPVQAYNLSKVLGVGVMDRFQLILEIFVKRAGTKEAKLQIELATLRRQLSFIREYINLAKRGELPGFMAGGEYALAVYEQHIRKRISRIEEELRKIREKTRRILTERKDVGIFNIALTGYTGAGKTTLFNTLTGEKKYVDGRPFATLSTVRRKVKIDGVPAVISDTIGFIDSLPPLLLEAFYTTLAELNEADLILLLVDSSEPMNEIIRKVKASIKTLEEVGVANKPLIAVLNKIDLITPEEVGERLSALQKLGFKTVVPISATKRLNIRALEKKIVENLPGLVKATLRIKGNAYNSLLSQLYSNAYVVRTEYSDQDIYLEILARRKWLRYIEGRYSDKIEVVYVHEKAKSLRIAHRSQTFTR